MRSEVLTPVLDKTREEIIQSTATDDLLAIVYGRKPEYAAEVLAELISWGNWVT